jgi:hypothetical protein
MSDKIEVGQGWTFDAGTQADIDAGRVRKVESVNVDKMSWQECCKYAKWQFEVMQYKAENALIGAVNRWCDLMLIEIGESVSKLKLAEFEVCLNIAQQLASDDQRNIKIGHPPRKILALLASMSQVIGFTNVEIPIAADEMREQARLNGLPYLANEVLALAEEVEELLITKHDIQEAEWDRWVILCSTAKRKDLLAKFWQAKHPMKRSEIMPGSGTGFRNALKELNELAASAKPFIPWQIRSDAQQKWSKHWFGKQGHKQG